MHVQNGPKMRMMAPAHRAGAIIKKISYVFGTNFLVSYERSETMDGCTEMIICAQSQKNRGDSLTIVRSRARGFVEAINLPVILGLGLLIGWRMHLVLPAVLAGIVCEECRETLLLCFAAL